MLQLIERICERLQSSAYVNEAAISHGVVTPVLSALGWDSADPDQLVPEYRVENGFVDFALLGAGPKPAIFIEVKGLGRASDGDRQLFQYAFHHGVPLCVLTDGRVWSFYVPSGLGSYDDRRVYRLQIDERTPAECEAILVRYLSRDRVRSGDAFADAQRDHQTSIGRREAASLIPKAWAELIAEAHDAIVDTLADKTEAVSGYRPAPADVELFLRGLAPKVSSLTSTLGGSIQETTSTLPSPAKAPSDRTVTYTYFGKSMTSPNASRALVDILREITVRDPSRLPQLAEAVRTPKMAHVGRSPAEINPRNPAIARAAEIAEDWMVGLNIDNRMKMTIIRAACEIWQVRMPEDLRVDMPNA